MMNEVEELLRTWELPDLVSVFNEQQITIQALSALNESDFKELIPLAGPRALFLRCWRSWKIEFSGSSNSSLPDISAYIDIDNLDPKDILIEKHLENEENIAPNCAVSNPEKVQIILSSSDTTQNILEDLLKSSLETSVLLSCKGDSLSGDSARNLLASTIAKEILRQKIPVINGTIYYKWACFIKELFPGERTTTYYIPACTTANGINIQARGKIVHQVLNKRRRLQLLGALPKKRSRSSSSTPSNPSPRPLPSCITDDAEDEEHIAEDLQWLQSSSSPWGLVEERWKRTVNYRVRRLYESNDTIESYFEKYSALKKPYGYLLLLMDFDAAYKVHKNNLLINFPLMKSKLKDLLKQKKGSEIFLKELILLIDSTDEENSNLAAFMAIPYLLNSSTVRQKRKKRGSSESENWKPSKSETRDGFIKHIKSDTDIASTVELRLTYLKQKGLSPQPYIIIVGESLNEINTHLIVANGSILYESQNIVQAVDTCYKIMWALNVEYGVDTYPVWYFIQKLFYKMTSKFDKGSTAVESLLTDCMTD